MTNCKNCGAPFHGGKCEYCGTEYETATMYYEPLPPPRRINPTIARYLRDRYLGGKVEARRSLSSLPSISG